MKKLIAVLLVVAALLALSGCSKTGTCELCGTENVSIKEAEVMGQSCWVCESCEAGLNALDSLL